MGFTSSAPSSDARNVGFLRLALSGEAGLLLLAWGLARWLQVSPLSVLQPTLTGLILGVAATVPLLVALVWMLRSSWSPVRRLVVLVTELVGALVAGRSLVALGALALLAGVSEEILFRGVIQQALTRWLPSGLAMVAASALFGLVHFASRAYAVFAAIMGLYLGTLFVITGNLFAPIVAHAAYDFVALVWLARGHA